MGVLKKWREMSWFRRVLVALLAGMILGGGIATTVVTGREGIKYQETLLLLTREGEACRYTGRLDGERAEFTVRPGGLVEYRWGEEAYGPYQVVEDPSAAPEKGMTGLEIRLGDETIFRGAYSGAVGWAMLQDESGKITDMLDLISDGPGGRAYSAGGRDRHGPSLAAVAGLGMDRLGLTHRGNLGLYLLATALAAVTIFMVCCPELMFRWNIMWDIRNPEKAEPSDWYLFSERVTWIACTGLAAYLYWINLTGIN